MNENNEKNLKKNLDQNTTEIEEVVDTSSMFPDDIDTNDANDASDTKQSEQTDDRNVAMGYMSALTSMLNSMDSMDEDDKSEEEPTSGGFGFFNHKSKNQTIKDPLNMTVRHDRFVDFRKPVTVQCFDFSQIRVGAPYRIHFTGKTSIPGCNLEFDCGETLDVLVLKCNTINNTIEFIGVSPIPMNHMFDPPMSYMEPNLAPNDNGMKRAYWFNNDMMTSLAPSYETNHKYFTDNYNPTQFNMMNTPYELPKYHTPNSSTMFDVDRVIVFSLSPNNNFQLEKYNLN